MKRIKVSEVKRFDKLSPVKGAVSSVRKIVTDGSNVWFSLYDKSWWRFPKNGKVNIVSS